MIIIYRENLFLIFTTILRIYSLNLCIHISILYMLSKPILHSRVGKWALALFEFSLTYQSLENCC